MKFCHSLIKNCLVFLPCSLSQPFSQNEQWLVRALLFECFVFSFHSRTNKRHIKITGDTPGKSAPRKPAKNVDVRPRRTLFTGSSGSKTGEFPKPEIHYGLKKKSGPCTDKELKGLVMYIALYWDGDVNDGWAQMKNPSHFWRSAALTVNEYSGQTIRSGEIFLKL